MWKMFKTPETRDINKEIHDAIFSAQGALLDSAQKLLQHCNDVLKEPSEKDGLVFKMKLLGFTNQEDVVEYASKMKVLNLVTQNREEAEKMIKQINRYTTMYGKQFITFESVKDICKRFNLVCAPISHYSAEIPVENMRNIADFEMSCDDMGYKIEIKVRNDGQGIDHTIQIPCSPVKIKEVDNLNSTRDFYNTVSDKEAEIINSLLDSRSRSLLKAYRHMSTTCSRVHRYTSDARLTGGLIIAPPHKFKGIAKNTVGFTSMFTKITETKVEDPAVLQPVRDGFLIVDSWGFESTLPEISGTEGGPPSAN